MEPCNRHEEMTTRLSDHDVRIRRLEEMYHGHEQQNKSIFRQLDKIDQGIENINKRIVSGMMSLIVLLVGFFFWYVQSGGGGG